MRKELDDIMEDLIVGHNFDYARQAILDWHDRHTEAAKAEEQNYGRIAALTDLLTWLKLHDIEDITMVQEYVNHVSASIKQFPNQPHVKHPDIRATLKGKR